MDPFRPARLRPACAVLLAWWGLCLPAQAQDPGAPDPAATGTWMALQADAAPWLELFASAGAGDAGRIEAIAWQARLARAARSPTHLQHWRRLADAAKAGGFRRPHFGALSVLSDEAYRRADIEAVEAIENEALATARGWGDRREEAASLYGLGLAANASGRPDLAETRFREAIAVWRASGDRRGTAIGERGLSRVLEVRGRYAETVELQVSALEVLIEEGKPIEQSESYYSLARLFMNLGDHDAALRGVNEAIRLMGDAPPDFPLGLNLVLRSNVLRLQGELEPALADADAATAAFARTGSPIGAGLAGLARGQALAAVGRGDEGLAVLREARATAVGIRERVLESDLSFAEGYVLVRLGRHREALAPLAVALAIGEELKLDRLLQDVSIEQEKAYSALGLTADALAASKRAYEARERMTALQDIGRLASDNARRPDAARDRFMALEAPAADTPAPAAIRAAGGDPLPRWAWALALPTLLLLWGLVRLLRHVRRLRAEKHQISSRQQALESEHRALRERVSLDPLTGCLTRTAFAGELASLLAHADNHGRSVALLVFDLDNFKAINDQHGHLAGDEALRLVTGIARGKLRSDDLLGRFGGDEYLVACEGLDLASAEALAEQMRFDVVWRAPEHQPPMPGLSISIGVAIADPARGYDPESLFQRADTALYRAKRGGRNQVQVDLPGEAPEPDSRRARQWGDALAE
ncbi:MAG TPA: tetratricopeptide repeat-containing diguanylate cyclase [Arenimonas sp.]|uniref:tetratricopeptide repeat-containing diguanylate cyclase n=1 Tax=Arenimonas sp. TaxID=1872635 RepID=UPI002D7F0FB9|nr:tetratricopeptide repeat-containing diguanylate cyclase [Arenimonas sp.]HEU0152151.1 tetratricopeptide repeat-containing diguanylate cyclase [Arenimonas sp.]